LVRTGLISVLAYTQLYIFFYKGLQKIYTFHY